MITYALGTIPPNHFIKNLNLETVEIDLDDPNCVTHTVKMPDAFEDFEIYIPAKNHRVSDIDIARAKTILTQLIEMDSRVRGNIGGDDLYRLAYIDITACCVHITYFHNQVNSEATACFDATDLNKLAYHGMQCRLAPGKFL